MFDLEGFPIFESHYDMYLEPVDYMRTRGVHFNRAGKDFAKYIDNHPSIKQELDLTELEIQQFANGDVPKKFTWHHHQDTGRMQLVNREDHDPVYHGGGYAIWGSGKN